MTTISAGEKSASIAQLAEVLTTPLIRMSREEGLIHLGDLAWCSCDKARSAFRLLKSNKKCSWLHRPGSGGCHKAYRPEPLQPLSIISKRRWAFIGIALVGTTNPFHPHADPWCPVEHLDHPPRDSSSPFSVEAWRRCDGRGMARTCEAPYSDRACWSPQVPVAASGASTGVWARLSPFARSQRPPWWFAAAPRKPAALSLAKEHRPLNQRGIRCKASTSTEVRKRGRGREEQRHIRKRGLFLWCINIL